MELDFFLEIICLDIIKLLKGKNIKCRIMKIENMYVKVRCQN